MIRPTDRDLKVLAIGIEHEMRNRKVTLRPGGYTIDSEGIWRTLQAPRLPILRPTISAWFGLGLPISTDMSLSESQTTLCLAAAHVHALIAGLYVLGMRPQLKNSISLKKSTNRQIEILSKQLQKLNILRENTQDRNEWQKIEQLRHPILVAQMGLLEERRHRIDSTGSPKERFIRNHLATIYAAIYWRPARHSHVGAEKRDAGGPFVEFAVQFAKEAGLPRMSPHTVAAALRVGRKRKAVAWKQPSDTSWMNKFLPKQR